MGGELGKNRERGSRGKENCNQDMLCEEKIHFQ